MIAEPPQRFRQLQIVGRNHSTFPGRDVLHRMKAECSHIRNASNASPVILRAQSMASVFDHNQPMLRASSMIAR